MYTTIMALWGWWSWHPPVSVWIGILGLLGVLVPLIRDIATIGKREKALWTFVMFALLLLEINSVYQDRNEHDKQQSEARARETENFKNIADGINGAITLSQQQFQTTIRQQSKQFAATMNIEKQNIDQITGGKSYVIVDAVPLHSEDDELYLSITLCHTCVDNLSARIYMRQMSPKLEPQHGPPIFEGAVDSNFQYSKQKITPSKVVTTQYIIQAIARNKPTDEVLEVRFNWKKREWESSWIIAREIVMPHYNPKTQMAEGLKSKVLQQQPWTTIHVTAVDPKTIKVIP